MRHAEHGEPPVSAVHASGTVRAPSAATVAARLLAIQRTAGNAAASALIGRAVPRTAAIADIARAESEAPDGTLIARAGTPAPQAPPDGIQAIQGRLHAASLGTSAGLTLVQHSGAFTPPAWLADARPQRSGSTTTWQPSVAVTQATDVVHESLYPAAGDHDRFPGAGNIQQIDGRTWRHVLRITADQSGQIRRGEQEHLDDAALAFTLTYQRVADAINEVAALTLPAQPTRDEAIAALVAALAARLPGLGTDPARWPATLDRLLSASTTRDTSGWHNVDTRQSRREPSTGLIVWPLDTSGLHLGVPSNQVVTL